MSIKQKLKLIEELNGYVEQAPSIVSVNVGVPARVETMRIIIELDADSIECNRNGCSGYVYMPKDGVKFNMRLITNSLRRICRKSGVDFSIGTPNRCYKSRKSTLNEFIGYDSPELILDIV